MEHIFYVDNHDLYSYYHYDLFYTGTFKIYDHTGAIIFSEEVENYINVEGIVESFLSKRIGYDIDLEDDDNEFVMVNPYYKICIKDPIDEDDLPHIRVFELDSITTTCKCECGEKIVHSKSPIPTLNCI